MSEYEGERLNGSHDNISYIIYSTQLYTTQFLRNIIAQSSRSNNGHLYLEGYIISFSIFNVVTMNVLDTLPFQEHLQVKSQNLEW